MGEWPYDVAKAKELLKEAGYPNGFETELWSAYNHTTAQKVTQFLQQQLQQIGIRTKITLLEAGQRVEKVESWQDPATAPVRLYYVGWSTSTGEADWALRPLLGGDSWPPKLFNTAYYKSDEVDNDIKKAQLTTDPAEKAKLYKDAQETIWHDAPWPPLPKRTPAGSRVSSRPASTGLRTTSVRGQPTSGAPRTHIHRSVPAPPMPAAALRLLPTVPCLAPA